MVAERLRLEYNKEDEKRIVLWEPKGSGVIETVFDSDGAVLRQMLFKKHQDGLEYHVKNFMSLEGVSGKPEKVSESVRLNRGCPSCGSYSLARVVDQLTDPALAPIMPIYVCGGCKAKSYYLTDKYLEHLVGNNKELFDEKELKEMQANKAAFMNELKEYIIRIFASKRIIRIK